MTGKNLRDEKLTRELGCLKSIVFAILAASPLLDQRKSEMLAAHTLRKLSENFVLLPFWMVWWPKIKP